MQSDLIALGERLGYTAPEDDKKRYFILLHPEYFEMMLKTDKSEQ